MVIGGVIALHFCTPVSSPAIYLAPPLSYHCPPTVHNTPLSQLGSETSLFLSRGEWAKVLHSFHTPGKSWPLDRVMRTLPCALSNTQCWNCVADQVSDSFNYCAGWPRLYGQGGGLICEPRFCFPQPLPWVSVPPMRYEKVLARGEGESPFQPTAMFPGFLQLPIEPPQPPILILGMQSTSPAKLEVATPEDEDSLSHLFPCLWKGKTWVCLHYWKALFCLYIENLHN